MSAKKKVDRAIPQVVEAGQTPEDVVKTGNELFGNVTGSAGLSKAPDVQVKLAAFGAANAALDANNTKKGAGRLMVDTALANEGPLMRRWGTSKRALLSSIEVAGDGSAEAVQNFNVAVEQRKTTPDATVPVHLRSMKVHLPLTASVRWDPTPGATGYMVQHASNPGDATTYSAQIHVTAARCHLGGQTPGATVYFRVLALDASLPDGQTGFCAWVAVVVV